MSREPNWFLLAAVGAGIAWLVNKQLNAASTTTSIPASDVVVPSDMMSQYVPGQSLLRGPILNGLGASSIPAVRTFTDPAPVVMEKRYIQGGQISTPVTGNAAPPVTMDPYAPVNANWSPDVKHNTQPMVATQGDYWQNKELAYLKANPNSRGPWIHNADGSVSRGYPKAGVYPVMDQNATPIFYAGAYQGTAAQVAASIAQNAAANVTNPATGRRFQALTVPRVIQQFRG